MFKKRRKKEICLLDDDWVLGKNENRKGAVKPRPLCTPLGLFFRSSWVVVCDTVLTFVCMLRCWMWNVVPRLFWVLGLWCRVRCWLLSVCFGIGCGTLCRGGCSGTVMRFSTCDARLRNSAIHVAYSREPQSMRHMRPRFHNPCGIYSRSSTIYAAYTAGSPQSILCNNISYRNIQSSVWYISA